MPGDGRTTVPPPAAETRETAFLIAAVSFDVPSPSAPQQVRTFRTENGGTGAGLGVGWGAGEGFGMGGVGTIRTPETELGAGSSVPSVDLSQQFKESPLLGYQVNAAQKCAGEERSRHSLQHSLADVTFLRPAMCEPLNVWPALSLQDVRELNASSPTHRISVGILWGTKLDRQIDR